MQEVLYASGAIGLFVLRRSTLLSEKNHEAQSPSLLHSIVTGPGPEGWPGALASFAKYAKQPGDFFLVTTHAEVLRLWRNRF
jgi:hypothetical protein